MCIYPKKNFWAQGFSLPLLLSTPHPLHFSYFLSFLAQSNLWTFVLLHFLCFALPWPFLCIPPCIFPTTFPPPLLFHPSFLSAPLCRAAEETGLSQTAGGESAPSLSLTLRKERVGVLWQRHVCVCLSDWRSASGNNKHVTGTPTLELSATLPVTCTSEAQSSWILLSSLIHEFALNQGFSEWHCTSTPSHHLHHHHKLENHNLKKKKNNEKALILLLATTD